ncbi:MAG: 4Fe-4S binding protein [Alistipes sp.]
MCINPARLIYFSPTGTSRRVGEAIVCGLQTENIVQQDVTLHPAAECIVSASELAIFVVPVYGGHLAPMAVERLKAIRGNQTPAVAVVVYGNRAYEGALVELSELIESHGFRVIAGATFIGEHSYSTAKNPIAVGRPNEGDLTIACNFGVQIRAKFDAAASTLQIPTVNLTKIAKPNQPLLPLLRFMWGVLRMRRSGMPLPKTPTLPDESLCVHCGICVDQCPVGAILRGDELHTDASKCIRCCACVKGCSLHARVYESPFSALLAGNFKKQKQPQILI